MRMIQRLTVCVLILLLVGLSACAAEVLSFATTTDLTVQDIVAALEAHPEATETDLRGASLTLSEQKSLRTQYPDVFFRWTVNVWNLVEVDSTETVLEIPGKRAGNVQELCDALDCLPRLETVNMWNIPLQREDRDTLYYGYPDIFFGWEIQMNKTHVVRTDATAFSTLGRSPHLGKYNMHNFAYCPNLLALDLGHNTLISLDFLKDVPKLKILIVAGCGLTSLDGLETQTDLEYLELFMNNNITDISCLANMTNLKDVNLSFTGVTDLSPLYDLPNLERVYLMMSNKKLKQEEVDRLREHQPNCEIVTRCYGSTGNLLDEKGNVIPKTGWRHHPHYNTIYYIFNGGGYVTWDTPVPDRSAALK